MVVVWSLLAIAVPAGLAAGLISARWPVTDLGTVRASVRPLARWLLRSPRTMALLRRRVEPGTATGLALTGTVLALLAGGLAVGILFAMVHQDRGFAHWDLALARWADERNSSASATVLRYLTRFGGHEFAVTACLAVVAWAARRGEAKALAAYLTVVLAGQTLVVNVLKLLVGRARPDLGPLAHFAGASFPSGHTATAASVLAALALVLGRRRGRATKAVLNGIAAGLAVAVAATRVLLGVHWFTDVAAGAALGWAWFALCSVAFGGRLLRFGAPVAAAQRLDELSGPGSDRVAPGPVRPGSGPGAGR